MQFWRVFTSRGSAKRHAELTSRKHLVFWAVLTIVLTSAYDKLSQVDSRNDSQMIFYDQLIPGSVLLGYVNADHWAVAIPINRNHPFISSHFVDKNAFPREVLAEALVRFLEEDLNRR